MQSISRTAVEGDLDALLSLIEEHGRGELLVRDRAAIEENLERWIVLEVEGEVRGCVSSDRHLEGLAELRSIVVHDCLKGRGAGRLLVEALMRDLEEQEVDLVFALSRAVGFFQRLGFVVCDQPAFFESIAKKHRKPGQRFFVKTTSRVQARHSHRLLVQSPPAAPLLGYTDGLASARRLGGER
ncbi:MAG: GNAT family N-acetyltransferase [Myxococcota bacterium]|nr:GNAT family N-acetyltransferase [Myxococcota bacterium]